MKRIATYILLLVEVMSSCTKSHTQASPASVNIVNAIANSQPIIPVLGTTTSIQYFATAQTVVYGSSVLYSPPGGLNTLYVVQSTDTTAINSKEDMFYGNLDLKANGIYSLFLAGDTASVDTLFVQDHITVYTDSSAGVRFVNLSQGSLPISVNIQGNAPTQTEFSNVAYKSLTPFKQYQANTSVPGSYTFEVRDRATDTLLTTFTWHYTLFQNNTLVVAGSEATGSTTPPLRVFQINNF